MPTPQKITFARRVIQQSMIKAFLNSLSKGHGIICNKDWDRVDQLIFFFSRQRFCLKSEIKML